MIRRSRKHVLMASVLLSLTTSSLIACKIPVFRYALERWPADRYRIVAIVDSTTNGDLDAAISELDRIGRSEVNIDVETIDLSKLSEEQLWQIESFDGDGQTPRLQVFFPEREGQRKLCWSGDLTVDAVRSWHDSRLRRQIADDITSGASAVWILVEGSDHEQNERMATELQSALAAASSTIPIPDGVIARSDASNYLQQHPGTSMDDVLRCDIPLKIEFVFRRLEFDDDQEPALRAIIEGWNTGLPQTNVTTDSPRTHNDVAADRAFVFPVFGRGRMVEPLAADRFSEHSVIAACRYIVGQCNCTMKALNPGVDLILATNWGAFQDDSLVMVDRGLPTTAEFVAIPAGGQSPQVVSSTHPATIGPLTIGPLTPVHLTREDLARQPGCEIAHWQPLARF